MVLQKATRKGGFFVGKIVKILHPGGVEIAYRWVSVTMRISLDQFRGLVLEHQRMVYGIALRLLQDPGEAEEVAQDVFLEFYDAVPRLESLEHAKFWLRRVATHRATDALRRRKKRPEALADMYSEEIHLVRHEEQRGVVVERRLEELVQSLPEPYRTSVILRYGEDATPDEIAKILHRPVATVKSHLQRALVMLRDKAYVGLKEWVR